MGTHPLAGVYTDKNKFIQATFARLSRLMTKKIALAIDSIHVANNSDTAIVEMHAESTLLNGKPFDNHYCWVCEFNQDKIVTVRAYLDSFLVATAIVENE